VLNAESISWYKSDAEQDKKYMIPMTDDLKVKSEKSESMFGNTTIKFTLFRYAIETTLKINAEFFLFLAMSEKIFTKTAQNWT
jgi:hypothetical protein